MEKINYEARVSADDSHRFASWLPNGIIKVTSGSNPGKGIEYTVGHEHGKLVCYGDNEGNVCPALEWQGGNCPHIRKAANLLETRKPDTEGRTAMWDATYHCGARLNERRYLERQRRQLMAQAMPPTGIRPTLEGLYE